MQEMSAVRDGGNVVQLPLFRASARGAIAGIRALSRPARTFTGDFYFTHRRDDRLWFAHGDVAGKGLPAAIVMAMIQEELEHRITSCAATQCDPAATMARLHEFLRPLLPNNRFATGVIGWLRDDGALVIANGGHCPPLIVRRDDSIEEIGSTGPLLGLLNEARWTSTKTRLGRGETLVLYSDGVIESCAELGVEGLKRVLRTARTPDEVMAQVGKTSDDVTLVMVTR
jgi:sigma-B regulation protein RsbU (phosphoserine phosphatase)